MLFNFENRSTAQDWRSCCEVIAVFVLADTLVNELGLMSNCMPVHTLAVSKLVLVYGCNPTFQVVGRSTDLKNLKDTTTTVYTIGNRPVIFRCDIEVWNMHTLKRKHIDTNRSKPWTVVCIINVDASSTPAGK